MKVALLAPGSATHTLRWANALADREHEVSLFSCHEFSTSIDGRVECIRLPFTRPAGYYLNAPFLKRHLRLLRPDVLHAHYASGYGTLARLVKWHPLVLSVWGSDVFEFPRKSRLNNNLLKKNLNEADIVCSTSHCMANELHGLYSLTTPVEITPFGVDLEVFSPHTSGFRYRKDEFVIGTVKTLEHIYGIDILIKGFAECRRRLLKVGEQLGERLVLTICGGGSQRSMLERLVLGLGCAGHVRFAGQVDHRDVPAWLNGFDIYVAVSRAESFGVAIIEASACEKPVVVSNVPGLAEVVCHDKTGIIVPVDNSAALADALHRLVLERGLRERLGKSGRAHVAEKYDWRESVSRIEAVYRRVRQASR